MKICRQCQQSYPDHANYCMTCGAALVKEKDNGSTSGTSRPRFTGRTRQFAGQWPVFWLTLGGSLVLSWLLIVVLHLPVFILGAFLPLLWYSRK